MQWRAVVHLQNSQKLAKNAKIDFKISYFICVVVKASLATLTQFARGMMHIGELHHFYSVFAVEVIH